MTIDKLQTRIDGASSSIDELTEAVKTLEAEIAQMDSAQAEQPRFAHRRKLITQRPLLTSANQQTLWSRPWEC